MTTDNGSSRSQGEVHADVKLEIVKADADLLTDAFSEGLDGSGGPARWFTDYNFGPDVACPRVMRIVEEEDDLKAAAETDEALERLGYVRTEESFRDRYGEGYVRKPEPTPAPTPAPAAAAPEAEQPGTAPSDDNKVVPFPVALAASDPKPLYVHRRLRNAADVIEWARSQGFTSIIPPSELHVTIAYSRRPVNWFAVADQFVCGDDLVVAAGGPRVIDRLGDQGAIVLHFSSGPLTWRNQAMRDLGASWDYADYHPHLTITYAGGDIDLGKIEPYRGKLVFGPEIFEPIEDGWDEQLLEVSLAEPMSARDVVDDAVDAIMADEGWRETIDPLVDQLRAAQTPAEVLQILSREAEIADTDGLTERLARAGFALRIDALTDNGADQ